MRKKKLKEEWIPLNDNVLLKILESLPELYKCEVIAVGPGISTYLGKKFEMDIKVNDIVLIRRHLLISLFKEKEKFLLVSERNILVKVKVAKRG